MVRFAGVGTMPDGFAYCGDDDEARGFTKLRRLGSEGEQMSFEIQGHKIKAKIYFRST